MLDQEILTRDEAEKFLRLGRGTLSQWAHRGKGPRYIRSGDKFGKVLYLKADLIAYLESRAVTPGEEKPC